MVQVLFGITGGISAFKAVSAIRGLSELGMEVRVVATANALKFVGQATLEALSHNALESDLFSDVESVKHVKLAQNADLVVVAPATAAFLARMAAGLADDLLGNVLLATTAPVLVVPAMHTEMWHNEGTRANVSLLRARGVHVMEPDTGRLTGQDSGTGRLPEADAIVATAQALLSAAHEAQPNLQGKRVLVTAGGTQEPIDPVRFLGNRSSGKQGIAFALAAQAGGADVHLIGANIEQPSGVKRFTRVSNARELQDAMLKSVPETDILVMAAAVSDYRVEHVSEEKIKREANQKLQLQLVPNEDLLKAFIARSSELKHQVLTVGFAAETAGSVSRLATLAEVKIASKGCDFLCANDVSNGAVFDSDSNSILLIDETGHSQPIAGSKISVASQVLAAVARN